MYRQQIHKNLSVFLQGVFTCSFVRSFNILLLLRGLPTTWRVEEHILGLTNLVLRLDKALLCPTSAYCTKLIWIIAFFHAFFCN